MGLGVFSGPPLMHCLLLGVDISLDRFTVVGPIAIFTAGKRKIANLEPIRLQYRPRPRSLHHVPHPPFPRFVIGALAVPAWWMCQPF